MIVKIVFFVLFILAVIVVVVQPNGCGTVSPKGKDVPWEAGVYTYTAYTDPPYIWRCGGSLISNKVVIAAAAHVFALTKNATLEKFMESDIIEVAVGKLSRPWEEPKDENTQKSIVAEWHISPGYLDKFAYDTNDIAVLIVADAFTYNDYIRPVCIDFNYDLMEQQLTVYKKGTTTGWDDADIVLNRDLPHWQHRLVHNAKELYYQPLDLCVQGLKRFQKSPLTFGDKFCMTAERNSKSSTICWSDIGIGIAFPSTKYGIERYYLRGVFAIPAEETELCSTNSSFLFTSLIKHEGFIRKYWNETEELPKQIGKCLLPPFPEYGTYTTNVTQTPGEEFVVVELTISCDRGYGVLGAASVICYHGYWHDPVPACVRMCQLSPHPSVDYRCVVSGAVVGSRVCGASEPIGTIVSPRCREHFYSLSDTPYMTCMDNGQWSSVVKCVPECGRVTPDGKYLAVGGTSAKKGELPWHAGIYKTTTIPYMQICGGSLISNKLIISAAHCFWTSVDKQLPTSQFAVAVGKIYRPWDDSMDVAQKSHILEIHITDRYQGESTSFQDDIAILVVAKPFKYQNHVRPVCLNFDTSFDSHQLDTSNKGKVAGWGLTAANGKASPVLQVVEMPYVEIGTCYNNTPADFQAFLTTDKICAGSQSSDTALCKGDSGGGLAFPAQDRGVLRYYLRGVVSTAPSSSDACNTHTYTSFTHVVKHRDFIKQYLTEN